MNDLVFVGDFDVGRGGGVEKQALGAGAGVGVEHEDLSEVGAGSAKQVEAVAFGAGKSLLVAKDDIGGVFVKLAEGDEAPALAKGGRAGGQTGDGEGLRVGKDAGVGLLGENSVEWLLADMGILTAAAVAVTPHSSLTARQVHYQMHDAGARWLFVSDAAQYEKGRAGGGKKGKAPSKRGKAEAAKPAAEQVWEESKAQDGLLNAGLFREGLGEYKVALKNREKFLELWPNAKEVEAVEKSILDLYEKTGQWAKVTKGLEEYEKKYVKDPSKVLTAEGRIAKIYEEKQKNAKAARGVYNRISDYYEKLGKKQRESLEITALDAVARANFIQNEDEWKKYSALKLRWSKLSNIAELKSSIVSKSNALTEIQKTYTRTVQLKSADPAICALNKIGMAYDQLAEQLVHFPVPKGLPEEVLFELKPQFEQQAEPVKKNATDAFVAAVNKSQELDIFNKCTVSALEMLRTRYAPEQYPKMEEDVLEVKQTEKNAALGGDLLTSIQPVPVITAEQAQTIKNNTQEVGSRPVEDTMPEVDLSSPEPSPKKAESRPAEKKTASPAPAKTASPDDEPEDTL